MLRTEKLSKIYNTSNLETVALQNIDLQINAGDFVAVMGPSGCGKSTLLNVLGLLDNLTKGELYFDGQATTRMKLREKTLLRKQNIGFVFQNYNLLDELTVYENIELPLLYLKVPTQERRSRIDGLLHEMQLMHRAQHFPTQLSGGQQQRVAIARAVVTKPKLILADEPTGNLDSKNGEAVMQLLASLNKQGTTILMVTHSTIDASYANRTLNLFDGQIVSENLGR
jgi:putative ABC transport system ATP-binding protein